MNQHLLAPVGANEADAGLDPARWYQASTVARSNPNQAEAPKTIAFEIVHQLGNLPDWLAVPIGGGATVHGIWNGFVELRDFGRIDRLPRLTGILPARFDAVHRAFHAGRSSIGRLRDAELPVEGQTVLRNLKHRVPPDGDLALAAVRASSGTMVTVSDAVALRDQARLAAVDGCFCEPSSAVVVAAIEQLIASRTIRTEDPTVAVITGSGFRELRILPEVTFETVAPRDVAGTMDRLAMPGQPRCESVRLLSLAKLLRGDPQGEGRAERPLSRPHSARRWR